MDETNTSKSKKKLTLEEKQVLRDKDIQDQIDYLYPPYIPFDVEVNGVELLKEITDLIDTWMVFTDQTKYSRIVALWILHTHCFKVWDTSPILYINSPIQGCGKSTLCSILNKLTFRPCLSQNSSYAALTRLISKYKVTCITDNFDSLNKEYKQDIQGLYDVGWEINGHRNICNSNNPDIVESLYCYGPKVISGLNDLQSTTKSRSIIVKLQKSNMVKINKPTDKRFDEKWFTLNRKITRWIEDNKSKLESIDCEVLLRDCKIDPRQLDIWKSLICISSIMDDSLKQDVIKYSIECSEDNGEQSASWLENLLINVSPSIKMWIKQNPNVEYIPLDTMVDMFDRLDIHLEYSEGTPKPNSGRKLIPLLRKFNIKCPVLINGKTVKSIKVKQLLEVFDTYVGKKESFFDTTDNQTPLLTVNDKLKQILNKDKEEVIV
jgi:hypothetical protein